MATIKDLIKKLDRFQEDLKNLPPGNLSIEVDENGMVDKQCHNTSCGNYFKVNYNDWLTIFRDEEVFCPFCRSPSLAKNFLTTEQANAATDKLRTTILDNWRHGSTITIGTIKIEARDKYELVVQCEKCIARYSVLGAAYFCPNCGYNSIERTAKDAVDKIISTALSIFEIQRSLEQTLSKDDSVVLATRILEQSLCSCVGTLQSFSESSYNHRSSSPAPFNSFQNTVKANYLWKELLNESYDTWLTGQELVSLTMYTQRRHLLEHKGGIVDDKYLTATGDTTYSIGDRIVVKPSDVSELGKIVSKIINKITNASE